MQTTTLACPFCGSTLNFGMTIAAGSPIECLICMQTFVAQSTYVPAAADPAPKALPAASFSKAHEPGKTFPAASTHAGQIKPAPKSSAPAVKPPAGSANPSVPKTAPKDKAEARPAPARNRLFLAVVAAGLLLLVGVGVAMWKIARSADGLPDPDPQVPQVAANQKLPDKPADPSAGTPSLPKKIAPSNPKEDLPTGDDDDDRRRALEAAKKLLIRKDPVEVGKEPEPDPMVPVIDLDKTFAWGLTQRRIITSVSQGVGYLETTQNPQGDWGMKPANALGRAALGGLTLLECNVPATDDSVQRAAKYTRSRLVDNKQTYDLSLAILFLDRLGDPRDRILIQGMALRLLAGQQESGAWVYECEPLSAPSMHQLYGFLQTNKQAYPGTRKPANGKPAVVGQNHADLNRVFQEFSDLILKAGLDDSTADDAKPVKEKVPPTRAESLKQTLQRLPVVRNQTLKKGQFRAIHGEGDNSNTHFAILALWAARRHNVPVEQSILAAHDRFLQTQNDDGGWPYGLRGGSTPSMTCVGLLAEAMGHGVSPDVDLKTPKEGASKPVLESVRIQNGLKALARGIGTPSLKEKIMPPENLYYLWTVERVAMLYDIKTIEGKDWYLWGAQNLVHNQDAAGAWAAPTFHGADPMINTCFALLFLKRSNLVKDLTATLRLRAGIRE